ncbi:DUF1801 domain-containing protein [Candidatus Dojkabacteria bacterium]|uniref:DUF1801 domain-containing protein n=1 Tax=Candidatus Dojkabacteria bacterium TaxID=2099670 RepID=A0A955L3X9_9BACT|nr:DUF1801 domain-containing protein [Candidatus Dojkabacteria bacterium]
MINSKPTSIDDYISQFDSETKEILNNLRVLVKEVAPEATEAISYGIPTFKLNGKNLVHFAGYKSHIGLYPGSEAIEVFAKKLTDYKVSKGTIQFPLEKPIPYDLVKEIVVYLYERER